jgi:hypothetical protein
VRAAAPSCRAALTRPNTHRFALDTVHPSVSFDAGRSLQPVLTRGSGRTRRTHYHLPRRHLAGAVTLEQCRQPPKVIVFHDSSKASSKRAKATKQQKEKRNGVAYLPVSVAAFCISVVSGSAKKENSH